MNWQTNNINTSRILTPGSFNGIQSVDAPSQLLFVNKKPRLDGLIAGEEPGRGDMRSMQPGRCDKFDGVNDYIVCGENLIGADDFTISLWIRVDALTAINTIFGMGNAHSVGGLGVASYITTAGGLRFFLRGVDGVQRTISAEGIVAGVWYHIALSVIRGGMAFGAINGASEFADVSGVAGSLANGQFYLGKYGLASLYFNGCMFDSQIFPRALSVSEVQQLYQLGTNTLLNEPRTGWWKLDDQNTTTALDSSGNGNHGTLLNMNATVGNFFYEGADVPHSYQNDKGYTLSGSVYVPRNEADKAKDVNGGTLQYTGHCPRNARLAQSNCLTLDGVDDYLAVASLIGSETVVSHGGTSTVTIAAGRINFTAGTCWDLLLSNGSHYPMAEGAGDKVYDIGPNAMHGTITNADLVTCWATKQNVYHYNAAKGFSHAENRFAGSVSLGLASSNWLTYVAANGERTSEQEFLDGTNTAVLLNDTSGSGYYGANQSVVSANVPAGTYTLSVYVKKGTSDTVGIWVFRSVSGNIQGPFDCDWVAGVPVPRVPATGMVVTDEGNGWFRLSGQFTLSGAETVNKYLLPCRTLNTLTGSTYFAHPQLTKTDARVPYYPSPFSVRYFPHNVPAKSLTLDALDVPLTHPAGRNLSLCESKIDLTQGVASPGSAGLPTAFNPLPEPTNPLFRRLRTKSGVNVAVDRIVRYPNTIDGNRLIAAQDFTQEKVIT